MPDRFRHLVIAWRVLAPVLLLASAVLVVGLFVRQPDARGATPASHANPGQSMHAYAKRDPLAAQLEARLKDDIRPLLQKYCYECHGNGKKKGGVNLDGPGDIKSIMNAADDWLTIVEVMNLGLMPPEKKPQPTGQEKLAIQQWVQEATEYYPEDAKPDPGWYTIHRLNRSEYRNTMRDLLGIDPNKHDLASHLPSDDTGYGFDNIADVLSMSTLQLEMFLQSAEEAIELSLSDEGDAGKANPVQRIRGEGEKPNDFRRGDNGDYGLYTNGNIWVEYDFPADGQYQLQFVGYGSRFKSKGPNVIVKVDGKEIETLEVRATDRQPQTYAFELEAKAGKRRISLHYTNNEVNGREDRNFFVRSIAIAGPVQGRDRGIYDQVFFIQPTADDKGNRLPGVEGRKRITESQAAREVIERFATRAFRRPADTGEVGALLRLYREARDAGDDYESAVKLALTATLVSPNFLYRPIGNPKPHDPEYLYELDDYELASRLSYFLWSSMPDDRLLELARARKLQEPDVLKKQVQRMLMDPRSDALVENFAGQWLLLRKLDGLEMDPKKFPSFDNDLRESMRGEAELFFADVLRNNRSVLSFLSSDRTFLNEKLAGHYGIKGIRGDDFREVELPADSARGGVLTMAATLTVTSHATRTSPVKRGDYVLAQLMGTAPPPPPPDVPPLEVATEAVGQDKTLREQLAAHVADPNCAVCHKRLDPIGLAMENFDAIGAWRDQEQGKPIDATGELPGGVTFDGPIELKSAMMKQQGQFVENLTKKLLTYAVGRGTEPFDRPTVKNIVQKVEFNGNRMQSLIEAIVLSDAFRKARGRETQP
jgi:mono/diheme cytochrome c family protein